MTAEPLAPPVRWILLAAAVLVFLAGVQLFVFPLRTDEYFAWTIGSPMTAVFLGAAYWSAVGLELSAARADHWAGARIALPTVFLFTSLTFVVTLVHLDLFHLGADFELRTRVVTWLWLAVYGGVPVLMLLAARSQRRLSTAVDPAAGLPTGIRMVLVALAVVLLVLGTALLVAPGRFDGAWPWPLTPLTGRAIGAWLVSLGFGAAHARVIDDPVSVRPLAVTGVVFGVLQAVALLRHGGELAWDDPAAWGYVLGLAVLTGAGAWTWWLGRDRLADPALRPEA